MKKILAWILAAAMLCAAGCAAAEGTEIPTFATVGEAIDAGDNYVAYGGYGDLYYVVLEKGGRYFRAVADLDAKANEMNEAIAVSEDIEAALLAYDAYLKTLTVKEVEEFTVRPMEQAELDALAGKTIGELEESGFEYMSSGTEGDRVVFGLANGVYQYDFVIDADADAYEKAEEEGSYAGLVVKSASPAGFSVNATEPRFHADGTVDPPEDPFAVYNDLMQAVSDAITAAEAGGEVDIEALTAELTEKFPDQAEMIQTAVQMYTLLGSQYLEAGTAEGEPSAEQ